MAEKHQSRIPLVLTAMLCILGILCGCSLAAPGAAVSSAPVSSAAPAPSTLATELTFAYTANDSLNPYLAKTKTNQELAGLLYDCLVVLNQNYEPEYRLAKTIEMKGTTVTISLVEAYFSDGSRVTAKDVLTSMEAAMEAETLSYKQDFAVVKEKTVTESGMLLLTLAHEDPYFVNFMDFPIFKTGSDDQQNDDNKDLPPIGSGRYVYHEESGEYWLTANPNWVGGKVNIGKIELLNLPDDDAIDHATQVGTVDWCYSDLSDNTFPNMNGISKLVSLSNLVYLGANMDTGFMSVREVRMGVSAAIDRSNIAKTAYFEMATPATGPYPAALELASGLQSISPDPNTDAARQLFDSAGFDQRDEEGFCSNGNLTLEVRLIYNKENSARESLARLVADRLKAAGCKVNVTALTFKQYQSAIQRGQYDLYVGEMQIPDNFDLYPLLTAGGLLSPDVSEPDDAAQEQGVQTTEPDGADIPLEAPEEADPLTAARAAYRYHNGQGSLTEMLSCFNEQLPIIPLCHRTGMLVYADSIAGDPAPLAGDPFHGLESCTVQ